MLLLVDDDPEFLAVAQKQLRVGVRGVMFALDADHARDLMRLVGLEFSVALIDLVLPGENGFHLIQDFHQHYPKLPLIAISGVLPKEIIETAKEFGAVATLLKPVTPEWRATIDQVRKQ